jgi:Ca-activated chloride channel family protein
MKSEHCALINKNTGKEVALKALAVKGLVSGLNTSYEITQKFANDENVAIEAVFTFPLPADATLSGLKIITGDKTIVTRPEEREKAFEEYDEAIQEGNGAYLLDCERPDLFVINLGNILPQQQVEIQISMFQLLQANNDSVRLSFPVAVVPKYFPAASAAQITEFERITPDFASKVPYGFSFALKIVQNGRIRLVESPSHPIRVEYGENEADVSLYQASAMPDSDVVINFACAEKFASILSHCNFDGKEHLLLELLPEFSVDAGLVRPKEVVFVVDCSGSMLGDSIFEAVNALQLCVRSLNEGDQFQIICFGSSWRSLFDKPQVLNDQSLAMITSSIANINADMGGTEILPALQAAVKTMTHEFSDLILFTDGAVGNEEEVFNFVAAKKHRCRFFPFGIGNGTSESLINGIAERGNGKAEFVFPGERIEAKVLRQFNRLAAPFLADVTLTWNCKDVEQVPAKIPAVFAGETVRIGGRLKAGVGLPAGLKVELKAMLGERELVFACELSGAGSGRVPALWWAQQRLNELEKNDNEADAGSRQRRGGSDKKQKTIIELSKTYGIISSLTSLVGIEERTADQKNDGKVELRRVPVMVPARRDFMADAAPPFGAVAIVSRSFMTAPCCPAPASLTGGVPSGRKKAILPKNSSLILETRENFCSYLVNSDVSESDEAIPPGSGSGDDLLVEILMHAGADGMFAMSEELLELLKTSPEEFELWLAKAPAHLSEADKHKYAMTALVKQHLEGVYADKNDLWAAIIAKSERKMQKMQLQAEQSR